MIDMGGGGGGGGGSGGGSVSSSKSIQSFQSALKDKLEPRVRNVFISFHVEDEAQVDLLRHQAKDNQFGIYFRDYSVKEPFDEKWKTQCRDRIAQTSACIVMIGPETATREAVLWETNECLRQGKKVIGVRISRYRNDPIPRPLLEHGCPVTDWNLARISKLLDEN